MRKLILLFLIITSSVKSQTYQSQQDKIFVYNALFGGIMGGVSELVANPRHVKHSKAFIHGFGMGLLGGSVSYCGKKLAADAIKHEQFGYVWPVRLLNSFGNSIIYNTAHSTNPYFQYFNIDIGPVQVSADVAGKRVMAKILPGAILGIGISLNYGGKFDAYHSVLMGIPCFNLYSDKMKAAGYSFLSSITICNKSYQNESYDWYKKEVRAHEFTHVLQYMEFENTSNILLGWNKDFRENKKVWKWLSLDLPYHDLAYYLDDKINKVIHPGVNPYWNNYYEFEANSFAKQKFVGVKK